MKILFDQGAPVPLRGMLPGHEIATAFERGWSALENGELMRAAEAENFDVLLTTDQNLRYQQNLPQRRLAIVVLKSASWPRIRLRIKDISAAIDAVQAGGYLEVDV